MPALRSNSQLRRDVDFARWQHQWELRTDTKHKSSQSSQSTSSQIGIIIAVALATLLTTLVILHFVLRYLRKRHPNPRYVPGEFLKRKWRAWTPKPAYTTALQGGPSLGNVQRLNNSASVQQSTVSIARVTADNPVRTRTLPEDEVAERHQSVRSIMTLPAYSSDVRPTEKLIGREGERGGIDMVVEFPETETEQEGRREHVMQSLYQIRVARRHEADDRTARRRQRQEARNQGDTELLARLEAERQRAAALPSPAEALLAEHQASARGRKRKVSSVDYAQLGIARHDGSRLRANSKDSDSRPLLDSAASMGSAEHLSINARHQRDRSNSSLRSATQGLLSEEDRQDETSSVSISLQSQDNGAAQPRPSVATSSSSSGSDPTPFQVDIAVPIDDPPGYKSQRQSLFQDPRGEAPPYESPVETGAPRLSSLELLPPQIQITPNTPLTPNAPHGDHPSTSDESPSAGSE